MRARRRRRRHVQRVGVATACALAVVGGVVQPAVADRGPTQAQIRWPPRNKRRPTSKPSPTISTSSSQTRAKPRSRPDPRRRKRTWPATVRRVCSSEPPRPPRLHATRLTWRRPAQTRPCCSCHESPPRSINRVPVRHGWTSSSARMGRRMCWTAPPVSKSWEANALKPPLMPTRPRWWPHPSRPPPPRPTAPGPSRRRARAAAQRAKAEADRAAAATGALAAQQDALTQQLATLRQTAAALEKARQDGLAAAEQARRDEAARQLASRPLRRPPGKRPPGRRPPGWPPRKTPSR